MSHVRGQGPAWRTRAQGKGDILPNNWLINDSLTCFLLSSNARLNMAPVSGKV